MHVIKERNVNGLLVSGLEYLGTHGVEQKSRNGSVFVAPTPVTSVYLQPCERVLFEEKRDANPFFHLFECLWMLSGRNKVSDLNRYVSNFGERYADNGVIHGAYGHRWRHALGFDQLDAAVRRLRENPDDRQCVIQMWNAAIFTDDMGYGEASDDLCGGWKDRPCNTHVYLRVRSDPVTRAGDLCIDQRLDLTVCCRSNDIIWGAYGANAVHFSFLQEYLAGRIGVEVGVMYQVSNNWHGYTEVLEKLGDPLDLSGTDPYDDATVRAMPIGTNFDKWDDDLHKFMTWHDGGARNPHGLENEFVNTWFRDVAVPMCRANSMRRDGDKEGALEVLRTVTATDWRMAAEEWMKRRMVK